MYYYQHHIGDYRRDTAHLSLLEHGIYRQLLDTYYLTEQPIPEETQLVCRRLSAKTEEEIKAVETILSEFFYRENGWKHKRCDMELRGYKEKADTARENGKLGGRPRKTHPVISGLAKETQIKANHEPLTINQEPNITTLSGDTRRQVNWDFVSGFIDGEANLRLNKYEQGGKETITARLSIYNTNREVLEAIQGLAGGSITTKANGLPHHKDVHELNFSKQEIATIVENCIDRVVIKREQMMMLSEFVKNWPENREFCFQLHERTKHLNERGKPDVSPVPEKNSEAKASAKRVLEFLNEKTGRAYRPVPVNIEKIVARMKEGATEGQCRQVIAKKSREWSTDERMAMYLRPATLFNREKFAQYVGELV